jgi:hypothetical protein
VEADSAESAAWFEVTETHAHQRLVAALGLRTREGARRIGWCTLAPDIEPWSYRDGLLQSLADYPSMRMTEPALARIDRRELLPAPLASASEFQHAAGRAL